ncbi:MAG TPA: FAD-dependent monooxygenase [Acidocella sp.]|jgi:2-polyprenyl-6-methoxyphenol hydroxylase-like FAD-dependent oxidoreductase|uniref:FAD-dependent monooxygenase n=1 Tax=Acidocella sp. TaxID=50710 RepID=UPI002CEF91F6|nr:FAD-dependent monooxygenase [Acidocella sp.]HVE22429.1 FAD-dependent monooxygenase [Acidocella sp.]
MHHDVLIVGAGPTGLVLALWLVKQGVRPRIIDRNAGPATTSHSLSVQARTLELYRQLNLADAVVARGHKVPAVNFWVKGAPEARLLFEKIGGEETPYPFLLIFPQAEHERLLLEWLEQAGVTVERQHELLGFTDHGSHITAHIQSPNGEEFYTTRFIAGCDGAKSTVRESLGIGFAGRNYERLYYAADITGSGPAFDGELHIDLDEADFLALFPLPTPGRARLLGTLRDERAARAETLTFADVSARPIRHFQLQNTVETWFSTFVVNQRVCAQMRKGAAFLLGDAAHIHTPAGGQGMNTGIGDAINLAWKLAAVLHGQAPASLLDSYEGERIRFARRLVATTDRGFRFATTPGMFADLLRTRLMPPLLARMTRFEAMCSYLFRTVSQINVNYRGSPLSRGMAVEVHSGDRLPWVQMEDGLDNLTSLCALNWQVHVYGKAEADLTAWCLAREIPLHLFPWREAYETAGLERDAVYLLRPDGYVGVADPSGSVMVLEDYCADLGLDFCKKASPQAAQPRAE